MLSPTKEKYSSREKVRRNIWFELGSVSTFCDYSQELSREMSAYINPTEFARKFVSLWGNEIPIYYLTAEQVSAESSTSAATSDTYDTPAINRSVRLRRRRGEHTDNRRQMVAIDLAYQIAKSGPWCQYIRDCADFRFLCIPPIIPRINNKPITRTVVTISCYFFSSANYIKMHCPKFYSSLRFLFITHYRRIDYKSRFLAAGILRLHIIHAYNCMY